MTASFDSSRVLSEETGVAGSEPVSVEDLLGLVDICGHTLSPDGAWVAFRTQRASVERDGYDTAWYVAPTAGCWSPVRVADGGEPVVEDGFLEGSQQHGGAHPRVAWAPDSSRFAFAVHAGEACVLWQVERRTGESEAVAELPGVVRALRYVADGTEILVRTSPRVRTLARDRPPVGAGILVGPASRPSAGAGALAEPRQDVPADRVVVVGTGELRSARIGESAALAALAELDPDTARSPDGSLDATIDAGQGPNLWVGPADAPERARSVPSLRALPQPWGDPVATMFWAPDGRKLYCTARDPGHDRGLYEVRVDDGVSRRVSPTEADVADWRVDTTAGVAVGLRETATEPVELVAVDLADGGCRTLTGVNEALRSRRFGRVRRVEATGDDGDPAWADLVHPLGYEPGTRYPLVVTMFAHGGFPRGAGGDEYPIHVLSAQGFFVLYLAPSHGYELDEPDENDSAEQRFEAMLRDMTGPVSSLRAMLDALEAEGVLDRDRVGVTGLSHGSDVATYALESGERYRAAVVSGLSHDDAYSYQLYGPGFDDRWADWGLDGGPDGIHGRHWRRRSPGIENITAAVLTHPSETEYLEDMPVYSRLRRASVPIEMHVYPGEDHIKHSPRHRLEIYRRTVDWFDYWLRDARDPVEDKRSQYARWDALRDG